MAVNWVYLHGFLSSEKAYKAELIRRHVKQDSSINFLVPTLDDHPEKALLFLHQTIEQLLPEKVCLIGSSLGGFYATWLAQYYELKAVLLNPAVEPHKLMVKYLGENINPYTGKKFVLTEEDMQVLRSHYVNDIKHPEKLMVVLQMADEVLDARDTSRRFYQSKCIIEPGGNHQFENFEKTIPMIESWLMET